MITIGYSTRTSNPKLIEEFKHSSGHPKVKVIEKVNNGEKNLSQIYNEIISESETDIIVLCHDDIYFETNNWASKLVKVFEKNPEYGILGMAGTTQMPSTGMWWENRPKMYGIVNHESDGKKWESRYSESQQNDVNNVVIVDGVFIAIHKNRIKELFDESVEGFHMYDINFCFKNFLSEVKIGVITNIRITHKSIGAVNSQWEKNKLIFIEKYKEFLPAKVKFEDNQQIKVLISCLFFENYTGSEMYVFDLSKKLLTLNCDVTVLATQTSGPLTLQAKKLGIKVLNINEPPGYKLGDGKWSLKTNQGFELSTPNRFYKITDVKFDIIHCQHKPIVELMNNLYPTIDKICSIHSEVINLELPVIHSSIKKYIAIRPEIKDYLISTHDISEKSIEVIYNPIDEKKFKPSNQPSENFTLFVGTIDYLRKKTILDLVEYTKINNKELILVGENKDNYLSDILLNPHVKHFNSTPNVETFIHRCDETAGILLGRTTIEGWMCDKPGWIYTINSDGDIINKELFKVPTDLEKFKSITVSNQIKQEYIKILNGN